MRSREAPPTSHPVPELGGFVLAGGRSSRLGTDKALVPLAGRPLILHALAKLRCLTAAPAILAGRAPGNPALAAFAPLVFDLHPGCGPLSGIEAALAHSPYPWNLILPVDVPFLPVCLLAWWIDQTISHPGSPVRIALFEADGRPQPSVLLLHREAAPYVAHSIRHGEYKLMRALDSAALSLSAAPGPDPAPRLKRSPEPSANRSALRFTNLPITPAAPPSLPEPFRRLSPRELAAQPLWFSNLNTPEDFAQARDRSDALPPLA